MTIVIKTLATALGDDTAPSLSGIIAQQFVTAYLDADLITRSQTRASLARMLTYKLSADNEAMIQAKIEAVDQMNALLAT